MRGTTLKTIFANAGSAKPPFTALGNVLLYALYVLSLPTALRYFGPPALQGDDSYFLLITYSWLNGLGFTNFWTNPIGSTVFNWHGFLQPMLIARLSPCDSLRCVNMGVVALGCVYLAIWYVIVNTITSIRLLRWALYVIAVSLVLKYSARPELLASLELICLVFLFYLFPTKITFLVRAIGSGIAVALALLTSPFTGAFAGLGVAAATAYLRRNDRSSVNFFLEGALSVVSALCVGITILVFIYPYSTILWIDGIIGHSIRDIDRTDTSGFFKFYFLTKGLPLLGIMFLTLAGIAGLAFKELRQARNRFFLIVFLFVCAALLYLLYFSAIRIPLTYYNFSALVPSLILIAIIYSNNATVTRQYKRLTLIGPTVAFAAACIFSQVIWAAQWVSERPEHHRLSEGIASSVDHYLAKNLRIAMDAPLAGAIDDVEKLKKIKILIFGEKYKLNYDPPDVDVLFRAENEFGMGVLAENMPGFKIVVDNFYHSPLARLLTPNEIYYAIYERVPH